MIYTNLKIINVKSITLNAVGYASDATQQIYSFIIDDFNKYSYENNLNIEIKFNLISGDNSTSSYVDYGSLVEVLLKKKMINMIFIFMIMFIRQSLPITLEYSVLYSNMILLNKYNKTVPKTWNELLETGKYILNEEKKQNNTDLIGYNGLFNYDVEGICSINEFIYSYRNSVDSSFPDLTSQESIDALEMIKKLKNELSSDYDFKLNNDYAMLKLFDGNAIFIKFWIFPESAINNNYDEYSEKFRNCIYEFIYGNKTSIEVLKKADDITRIHYISINTNDSPIGLIFAIINSILIFIMVFSMIFLFFENFNPFFDFFSIDLWFLLNIGSILILCSIFTKYGTVTSFKCRLMTILFFFGLSLIYISISYKLIINFPVENNLSEWIKKHKTIYLFILIIVDIILNSLYFINEYDIENVVVTEGQNFQVCKTNYIFSKIMFRIEAGYHFLMILAILILSFMEWNLHKSMIDIRLIVYTVYADIILFIILLVLDIIKIKNYVSYFVIKTVVIMIFSISNYVLLYGLKLIVGILNKKDVKMTYIKSINKMFINNETTNTVIKSNQFNESSCISSINTSNSNDYYNNTQITSKNSDRKSTNKRTSIISKMIDYHYTT
ncbi:hypothetical protein BCR32DRAFT_304052 [Anaeromyces robustus]|uniref:G-protein coupled receptors family 3 profile domain-containing protein n=1 Tax=Anaeromyces robustus TaxID=1754192 RepID=A0A1Y1WRS0_9FUNG|nr:hypothetical protein BCR32DRAFT_304052 [Anaeromyces robustus]|eukprot:ORX76240.1 hypothetical protein BCR32DRAFT_304052 [Anaeromyces robustus]